MIEHIIVMNIETSLTKRTVRIYLKQGDIFKEIEQLIDKTLDIESYISERIDRFWEFATLMPRHFWDSASGNRSLDVQIEPIDMTRFLNSDNLIETIKTLESEIDSEDYIRLKESVRNAKAAERNQFFTLVGYLIMRKMTQ